VGLRLCALPGFALEAPAAEAARLLHELRLLALGRVAREGLWLVACRALRGRLLLLLWLLMWLARVALQSLPYQLLEGLKLTWISAGLPPSLLLLLLRLLLLLLLLGLRLNLLILIGLSLLTLLDCLLQ
jgi:hypothetical protein